MPNWTQITQTHVETTKVAALLAAVQAQATTDGKPDPLPEMIADVVAQIRGAISAGNALDVDTTKIPMSLKGLALRMVTRRLKDFIEDQMTEDERLQAKEDASYLNRIIDSQIRFELPDNSAGSGEMQGGGGLELITSTNRQNYSREGLNGL